MNEKGMVVHQRGVERRFGWHDVQSFWTVPFVTPPILRLRLTPGEVVVYFIPINALSVNVGIWTFHFSGMGRFIRQQIDRREGWHDLHDRSSQRDI